MIITDSRPKDVIGALLGSDRKKRRHKHKGDSVTGVSANLSKAHAKGLSGNRSAENLLQRMEEESAAAPRADPASETVEVSFEIRKKYDVKQLNYFCVENEKRSIRRARSNDSLMMQHQIVVRRANRAEAHQSRDKLQTLPRQLSKSIDIPEDYASSGDTTTSEDARSESCGSSVLESEL